jgi:hypothetical protein
VPLLVSDPPDQNTDEDSEQLPEIIHFRQELLLFFYAPLCNR